MISPLVLDAAEQIGRAIERAEKLLIDPAAAAGLLEEAAATVSRALASNRENAIPEQQPAGYRLVPVSLRQNCARIRCFHAIEVSFERKADSPIC